MKQTTLDEYVTRRELREELAVQTSEIVGVIHDLMDRFDDRFARLELRMDRWSAAWIVSSKKLP